MNRYDNAQIRKQLTEAFDAFASAIKPLEKEAFESTPGGKWSAGQHLDHLILSVKPINQALILPGFILKMAFGKANRPSVSYDELVGKYQKKLAAGAVATGGFVPPVISFHRKEKLLKAYLLHGERLVNHVKNRKEEDLDTIIAPHPLLGKVTLRELMYFTIYHTHHHLDILEKRG
ncbi:MAG: DinB family protein [Bacteroidia bacterium]|nr:DinB family protein [Bacteroidia bacterium]